MERASTKNFSPKGFSLGQGLQYITIEEAKALITDFGQPLVQSYTVEQFAKSLDAIVNFYIAFASNNSKPLPSERKKDWARVINDSEKLLSDLGLPSNCEEEGILKALPPAFLDDLFKYIERRTSPVEIVLPENTPIDDLLKNGEGAYIRLPINFESEAMAFKDKLKTALTGIQFLIEVAKDISAACDKEAEVLPKKKNSEAIAKSTDTAREGLLRGLAKLKVDAFEKRTRESFVVLTLGFLKKKKLYAEGIPTEDSMKSILGGLGTEAKDWS